MGFLDDYKSADRSKMESDAFQYLVSDLMQDNTIGYKKTREISALNMEQMSSTAFVPSMFYMFMYVSKKMESVKGFNFYDAVPLILCTSFDVDTITGFNFNYIPNNVRASVLDIITKSYSEFYDEAMQGDGNFRINNQFGMMLTNPQTCSQFSSFVRSKTGVDMNKTLRTYIRRNIIKTRMIEYDMWKYIPYLVFKDAVHGANLADVQISTIDK